MDFIEVICGYFVCASGTSESVGKNFEIGVCVFGLCTEGSVSGANRLDVGGLTRSRTMKLCFLPSEAVSSEARSLDS